MTDRERLRKEDNGVWPTFSVDIEGVTPDERITEADVNWLRGLADRLVQELEAAGYRVDRAVLSSELGAEYLEHRHDVPPTFPRHIDRDGRGHW